MELWRTVCPDCAVFNYEQASNNISEFFFRNVLHLTNTEGFEGLDLRMNIRLSRDILEYKRMLNSREMSGVDRYLSNLACIELAEGVAHDSRHEDYLAPDARMALLREMESNNALLCETYGIKPFPVVSEHSLSGWKPYPGLSTDKAMAFAERHAHMKRAIGYRIERSALMVREFILRRLPMLAWLIPFGRSLLPRHRHLK
jgi:hypothetical protein